MSSQEVLEKRIDRIATKLLGEKRSSVVLATNLEAGRAAVEKIRERASEVYLIVLPKIDKPANSGAYVPDSEDEDDRPRRSPPPVESKPQAAPLPDDEDELEAEESEPPKQQPTPPAKPSLAGHYTPNRRGRRSWC